MHNHFPFFHIQTTAVWVCSMFGQKAKQNATAVWPPCVITECYGSMIAVCQDRMLSQYGRSMHMPSQIAMTV